MRAIIKNTIRKAKGYVISALKKITVGKIDQTRPANAYPIDFTEKEKSIIKSVEPFTMTSSERLVSLSRAIDYIEKQNIEGSIVECGVWRGGSMMLTALKLKELQNMRRSLYLFDTFEGMTAPTNKDKTIEGDEARLLLLQQEKGDGNNIWCISGLEEVKQNLRSTGYPENNIHFIKGKVEDTLPYEALDKIALLRLDTDWYESTKHELENLFDKIEVGGVLIIDDYGHWSGAKKAVDEYLEKNSIKMFLNRIDYTGRIGIKLS